jgi:hypothetical protein
VAIGVQQRLVLARDTINLGWFGEFQFLQPPGEFGMSRREQSQQLQSEQQLFHRETHPKRAGSC